MENVDAAAAVVNATVTVAASMAPATDTTNLVTTPLATTSVRCAARAPVHLGHLVRAELPLKYSDAVLRQSPPPPVLA
jgi:hypothetical protein